MDTKIMAAKLKDKVDKISSSSVSSYKSINELKIYVAFAKKSANTIISKLWSFSKKWRSSEDAGVQGGFTHEEESVLTVKGENEGTEGVLGENSLENTIEDTQKGRSIDMVRLKTGGWIG